MDDDWYEELFEKHMRNQMKYREEHEFKYYSDSMGCYIHGKDHYIHEMKKRRLIPYDMAEEVAETYDKENPRKEYKMSSTAKDIISSLKLTSDEDGNIRLGSVGVKALQEIGAIPTQHQIDIMEEEGLI